MARPGGELRGNCYDRRRRKEWMLSEDAGFGGDGSKVPCTWCGRTLRYTTLEADRVLPGDAGGRYVRGNVVPSCRTCNEKRNVRKLTPKVLTHHPLSSIVLE